MENVLLILSALLMLEGGMIGVLCEQNRKLQRERDAARLRAGYPWDWTREDERLAASAMELICDKCHEQYRCSQDELDAECALCPVPDVVYRLATGAAKIDGRRARLGAAKSSEGVRG